MYSRTKSARRKNAVFTTVWPHIFGPRFLSVLTRALLIFTFVVSYTHGLRAQQNGAAIGRVEGNDISVEGAGASGNGGTPSAGGQLASFLVSNGNVVTVHVGQARMTLAAGGRVDICGPAKFTVLESGGAITLALNFGRMHVQIPATTSLRIYTPTIIATPLDIGGAVRDINVGLGLNYSLCGVFPAGARVSSAPGAGAGSGPIRTSAAGDRAKRAARSKRTASRFPGATASSADECCGRRAGRAAGQSGDWRARPRQRDASGGADDEFRRTLRSSGSDRPVHRDRTAACGVGDAVTTAACGACCGHRVIGASSAGGTGIRIHGPRCGAGVCGRHAPCVGTNARGSAAATGAGKPAREKEARILGRVEEHLRRQRRNPQIIPSLDGKQAGPFPPRHPGRKHRAAAKLQPLSG